MRPAERLPRTAPERFGQTGSATPSVRRTSSSRATTGPAPAPLHSSRGTRLPAHSTSIHSSNPACLLSCQRVDTDIPQLSQPAPDGWSCKGRGDDMRHPLVTDAPALRKLCSRARAGGDRLGPQYAGHPAQTRPLCALDCTAQWTALLRLTTGAPWDTQARCRWADRPVPVGLQAVLGRQGLPNHLALRQ